MSSICQLIVWNILENVFDALLSPLKVSILDYYANISTPTVLCWSSIFSCWSNLDISSCNTSNRSEASCVFSPATAPWSECFNICYWKQNKVAYLPFDTIFVSFFNQSNPLQNICNIINAPFLSYIQRISRLQIGG